MLYDECNEEDNDINPPYPVNVEFEGHESGLRWTIAVQEGLVDEAYFDWLINMLNTVLFSIINDPKGQLVRRKEDSVSICGLPPVKIELEKAIKSKPSQRGETSGVESSHAASEDWSPLESQIRGFSPKSPRPTSNRFRDPLDSTTSVSIVSVRSR